MPGMDANVPPPTQAERLPDQSESQTRPPIFIFGVTRSGTTLLTQMLDLHPNLSIYLESGFLHQIPRAAAEKTLTSDAEVGALLDRVRNVPQEGVSRDAVERRFATSDRRVRTLFDTILRVRMQARGKRRYGEKTPSHFWKLALLLRWYPEAKLIFLFRDPRDVYASFQRWREFGNVGRADSTLLGRSLYWNYYQRVLQQTQQCYPGQVFEVKFESLVREPRATLEGLCDFLGEELAPSMLAVESNNSMFPETRDRAGLRPEVLDRKRSLNRTQTALIELICGEYMLAKGCRLSPACRQLVPMLSALGFYTLSGGLHGLIRRWRYD